MTVRLLIKAGKILALTALIVVLSMVGGVITVVWSQGAQFRVASSCAAVTGVGAGSFCIQLGAPPSFWWYTGSAWAQNFGTDTTGGPTTLGAGGAQVVVAMAGQKSAVVWWPANVTLASSIIKPIVSVDGGVEYMVDVASFVTAAGATATSQAFALGDPTKPLALKIETLLPATHLGVRITTYGSGNASTTVKAVAAQPTIAFTGTDGTKLLIPTISPIGSTFAQEVAIGHALGQFAWPRFATATVSDTTTNCCVTLEDQGGGQVSFDIPSGATATFAFEVRAASGTWNDGAVFFKIGSASSFPARGHFLESNWTGYRVRATVLSAGTTVPVVWGVPGAGVVRSIRYDGTGNIALNDPCSGAKTTTGFSQTASAVIVAKDAAKKIAICSLMVGVTGSDEIVSVLQGDGTVCSTNQVALIGNTTAAQGVGKSFTLVGGESTVLMSTVANRDICLIQSGANRVAGFMTWAKQ